MHLSGELFIYRLEFSVMESSKYEVLSLYALKLSIYNPLINVI